MAAFALRTELAFVEVGMAIGAARSSLGKNFRDVARITRDILVHAAKLEAGFRIVIELDSRTQRRPICGGVTVLTWKRKFPVRVGDIDLRERR
jgi:hypothetical protein